MWRVLRFTFLGVAFLAAVIFGDDSQRLPYGWSEAIILAAIFLIISIIWVLAVCLMQDFVEAMASYQRAWQRPSFSISPFSPRKPLQFWYFVSIVFLCAGVGFLIHSLVFVGHIPPELLIYFSGPIGMLLGCRWALRLFRKRFIDETKEAEQDAPGEPPTRL